MTFNDLYITKLVMWRGIPHYITNIFQSGVIIVSPKGRDRYYHINYTQLDEIIS